MIDGFAEVAPRHGLRQAMAASPLIVGVWTWGRGGGWQGPYISGGGNGAGGSDGGGVRGSFARPSFDILR